MVVPLVAIAGPVQYVTDPLRVFELDFEANFEVLRYRVKYGMAQDRVLDEETTR